MSASNVRTSSTPATASTLRPRTRRLISGLDEGDESTFDPSRSASHRIASPALTPFDDRSVSPIPSTRLPRSGGTLSERDAGLGTSQGPGIRRLEADGPNSLERLWGNSWTAIQGIASELMGNDGHQGPPLAKGKVPRTRRPMGRLHSHRASSSAPPSNWGPKQPTGVPTIDTVGTGTREETEAAFRAQKRKDLLTNQPSSYTDSLGKFKRRTSDDGFSASAPPIESEDRDALVYLHHVQKRDTLAGLTIKFNCSANTLRRANRMWPNDTILSRDVIFLPVDACGTKGRPVSGPEEVDILGDENAALSAGLAEEVPSIASLPNGGHIETARDRSNSSYTSTTGGRSSSLARSSLETEPLWHHNSWVLLPGYTKPVEIARLSRRSLGFFPPARRKSNSLDFESPSNSFDNPRGAISEILNQPPRSPVRRDFSQRPRRSRAYSNSNNGYSSYLSGPGGVGSMNKDVRAPGPAPDGLNKLFAKHLPDVAPPRNQHELYQPETPLYSDDLTPVASGIPTPTHGANKNLENVGGAIEAWVRRVASKAKDAIDPAERQKPARASVGTPGKGAGGIGDLIEMTDEFEIGVDDEHEEEYVRGRLASNGTTTASSYFPDMGRQRDSKVGKSD